MSEQQLVPIDLPPGIYHNGTKLQASGRWYDGNGVRFYQGTKQPIGGWVRRTLSGATMTGRPNAAVSWETNAGNRFIAVGTSTGLFIVDSSNVVHDIMPTGLVGGAPYSWQLTTFGSYLAAAYALTAYNSSNSLNVLVWKGDTSVPADQAFDGSQGPNTSFGIVTTPERFFVVLRGSDPNGAMHRVPTGGAVVDPTLGTVTLSSSAGTPVPVGGVIFDPSGGGLVF